MSDQELRAFLEAIALEVHLESRATRACVVIMAVLTMLVCWFLA
jgi:hypothetical protein